MHRQHQQTKDSGQVEYLASSAGALLLAGEKTTIHANISKVKWQRDRSSLALPTLPATDVPTAHVRVLLPTKASLVTPLCSKHPNHSRDLPAPFYSNEQGFTGVNDPRPLTSQESTVYVLEDKWPCLVSPVVVQPMAQLDPRLPRLSHPYLGACPPWY